MQEDIYSVSVPLTAGVLCSHLLGKSAAFAQTSEYCLAALTPLLLAPLLAAARRSRIHLLWFGVFFLIGVLLHSIAGINAAWTKESTPIGRMLENQQRSFSLRIDAIPFRDAENIALMKALLLGDRGSLSAATTSAFRTAGAAHLLALSGMHLGIIYGAALKVLGLLGSSFPVRRARHAAIILLCLWYTLLCGAADSLLRAWLFILLREAGALLERPQPPGHILCAALTLHLVLRPLSIGNIGFQLSYLAMVGIVFVWPLVRGWVDGRIWQAASLSICCQIFTAPLTLLYFGTFPKYFLVTNLVAAPLLGVVLIGSVALMGIGAAVPEGAVYTFAVEICEMPLTLLRRLLETIAALP